jgi:hypothetical protein
MFLLLGFLFLLTLASLMALIFSFIIGGTSRGALVPSWVFKTYNWSVISTPILFWLMVICIVFIFTIYQD